MKPTSSLLPLLLLLVLLHIEPIVTWESYELDLFDLVEELGLNNNFYQFLSVDSRADVAEIKRAYRKLSLLWHPDKSDDPNAEQKFRHLVAVYEILKDEQRRARYDRILVEGLPKWNQPIYYYRRAKKLRFWEMFTILSLIITIGHYLVLWAIYFESSLSMNERSNDVRKRLEKKLKKSSKGKEIDPTMIDEEIARLLPVLRTPQFTDILPIRLAQTLVDRQFFIPDCQEILKKLFESRRREPVLPDADDDDDDQTSSEKEQRPSSKRSPVVRIPDVVPQVTRSTNIPVVSYLTPLPPSSSADVSLSCDSRKSNRPWTDDEKQLLCKTIVRFPPGTPRRWEKVAEVLGRHVSQVTEIARQIQNAVGSAGTHSNETQLSFSSPTMIDENLITERSTTVESATKTTTTTTSSSSDWSQADQKLLENALKVISKDLPGQERWERIAECVPGKTAADCLARYRLIVQMVRAKKLA